MKLKNAIHALQASRDTITFPTAESPSFAQYKQRLIDLLRANLESYAYQAKALDYDPTSRTFWFTVEASVGVGRFRGVMTHNFSISIDKDVGDEVVRILKEEHEFKTACFATLIEYSRVTGAPL